MSLINDINLYCHKNNIRRVGKRILVAEHLIMLGGDIDPDILWRSLRKSQIKISIATVYNSLNWLNEAGFIEKKCTNERKTVFFIK